MQDKAFQPANLQRDITFLRACEWRRLEAIRLLHRE